MKKLFIILLLFISVNVFCQTTLYLNTGVTSPITPAVNVAWNVTTGNTQKMMKPVKDGSTIASITSANTGAAAVRKVILAQWISEPLTAQTVNGTLTGQIRYNMSSVTSRTGNGFVYLRILNANNTVATEVGTLTTTALTTTLTNRTLISLALSAVSIPEGGRICLDIGWNYATGTNTATNATGSFGSSSGTNLPADNTTTAANNPFVTFSQTLIFQKPSIGFF